MKHLYFVPGLAANSKIFEHLSLPKEKYQLHFLEWKNPVSLAESIVSYAKRMCKEIHHKKPVLIGVSFGGVIVQEMSKLIDCEKVIIISSIKNNQELPKRLRIAKYSKIYKLFPVKMLVHIEEYEKYFLGSFLKKRAKIYKTYLSVRDPIYLHWAIYNLLYWQQSESLKNIIHIHGEEDSVFPVKHIKNYISVANATHIMILTKVKTISKHILCNI